MTRPKIFWFRRDLRLDDHPGLVAAAANGAVIPVFILDPETKRLGAAPKWRLGVGLEVFAQALEAAGSRLTLRQGDALEVLRTLVTETGAEAVHWSRCYDPTSVTRDKRVKTGLDGIGHSHPGHVLFEPWTVETGQGGFYRVYTPFWKAVRDRDVGPVLAAPELAAPKVWPESDSLADWHLQADMQRGAAVVGGYAQVGSAAALAQLHDFMADRVAGYKTDRDRLDLAATSGLSENLALGEISARQCWAAGWHALHAGKPGAEHFLKEVVWRDFAYHLVFHTPHIVERNWREDWDGFPWRGDNPDVLAWKQGRTGEPLVDAAMREMYVTGRMHNRARMLVASYLTKHLMTDWRVGMRWFEDCLIDWDPASNAMGWQWTAGCGPDASPYFRIFNPATQAEKFDPHETYRRRWVAELSSAPGPDALAYFDAIPKSWNLMPDAPYPDPMIDLKAGREAALAAYSAHKEDAA